MKSEIIERLGQAELLLPAPAARMARLAATTISEGDWLSIDGEAGAIYLGRGDVVSERPDVELAEVERWRAVAA